MRHEISLGEDPQGHVKLAAEIRAVRARLGWSQERVASRADVHRNTVSRIENAGEVRPSALFQVCRALGIRLVAQIPTELPSSEQ